MTSKKILIVDDEINILELLEFNLKKSGYDVIRAENGSDAINLCNSD
jgi:two-component system alkaline phosphatase synthesis response regulator PhoP